MGNAIANAIHQMYDLGVGSLDIPARYKQKPYRARQTIKVRAW